MGARGVEALVESERVGERAEFLSRLLHRDRAGGTAPSAVCASGKILRRGAQGVREYFWRGGIPRRMSGMVGTRAGVGMSARRNVYRGGSSWEAGSRSTEVISRLWCHWG